MVSPKENRGLTADCGKLGRPGETVPWGGWRMDVAGQPVAAGRGPAEALSGDPLLEVRSVSKLFGGTQALDAVSMGVSSGEIVALLGENGAG
jgi:hypothetical protein